MFLLTISRKPPDDSATSNSIFLDDSLILPELQLQEPSNTKNTETVNPLESINTTNKILQQISFMTQDGAYKCLFYSSFGTTNGNPI